MINVKMKNNNKVSLAAIYKPPEKKLEPRDSNDIMRSANNGPIIIAGDFNAKHTNWKNPYNNPDGNELKYWLDNNTHLRLLACN